MPIHYLRDDVRRRVVVTIDGLFQTTELLTFLDQHRRDAAWPYAILYDLRSMIGSPTVTQLREIMGRAVQAGRARGPVAIVVTDPAMYSMACTYAALGHAMLAIRIFRDLAEAERWLDEPSGR